MAEGFITRRGGVGAEPTPDYIQATGGSILTYENSGTFYKVHTFKTSGNFNVLSTSTVSARNLVEYVILAGGGGGGHTTADGNGASGGGGAGGFRSSVVGADSGGGSSAESRITATQQSFSITVGAGGNGSTSNSVQGGDGGNSIALGITSTGGGGGGSRTNRDGRNGGSGGGSAIQGTTVGSVGQGTSGQGFSGGLAGTDGATFRTGGGGGGASQAGFNASFSDCRGRGGSGLNTSIDTTVIPLAGGGSINFEICSNAGGMAFGAGANGTLARINTGSGGGGRPNNPTGNGGNGSSGIVMVRYEVGGL